MNFSLKKIEFPKIITIVLILMIAFSVFVRAQGLGYSSFQGDEVNPMDFLYEMDEGPLNYLLEQKRGPGQYVVNLINVGIFGYHNEAQIRFPFLLFGVFALLTVFIIARKLFDTTSAFFAVVLMSVNGLFIAFARITQYQSLMYFLIPIGIYIFIRALEDSVNTRKLIISGFIMTLALLAHYDTLSVVPFFIVGFVGYYFRKLELDKNEDLNPLKLFKNGKNKGLIVELLKKSAVFFLVMLIPALMYYIPFYMNSSFDDQTSSYLSNRLFGGGFMPRTVITIKLVSMYIPKFHIYTLFFLGVLALLFKTIEIDKIKIAKINLSKWITQNTYLLMVFIFAFGSVFSLYPIKPRSSSLLVIGSAIAISIILLFSKKVPWKHAAVMTWFLGAYSFYFFIMKDPRTHVYVSILPLFILAGYGFVEVYRSIKWKALSNFLLIALIGSLIFVSGVNWVIFVNRSPEYPWWDKDFMDWPIYRINRVRHKKIEGVFGFNNYRGWDKVRELYDNGCLIGDFNSNEKDSISYFYTKQHQKQGSSWGLITDSDNLIIVEGPHSWEYFNLKDVPSEYTHLATIYSEKIPVSYIYGKGSLYPQGELLCK